MDILGRGGHRFIDFASPDLCIPGEVSYGRVGSSSQPSRHCGGQVWKRQHRPFKDECAQIPWPSYPGMAVHWEASHGIGSTVSLAWYHKLWPVLGRPAVEEGGVASPARLPRRSPAVVARHVRGGRAPPAWLLRACPALLRPDLEEGVQFPRAGSP